MHKGYKCLDKSSGRIYISRDVVFDEYVFPDATPRVSADIPSLREAITFPTTEPATHDHVCQYDLSYLSTKPPLLGDDATPVQVPYDTGPSAPPAPAQPPPAAVADLAVSPAAPARGDPTSHGSPLHVLDAPEQPKSPPADSPPTPAATPPTAGPLGHGMVTRLQENTHCDKTYTKSLMSFRSSGVTNTLNLAQTIPDVPRTFLAISILIRFNISSMYFGLAVLSASIHPNRS
jgi:hypothetical protein